MRAVCSIVIVWFFIDGCVDVTDLREDKPPALQPPGQVDTGWTPDLSEPDLPPAPSCLGVADCAAWIGSTPCREAACIDGFCEAHPMEDGTQCSDGDFQTLGDRCKAGNCAPGPIVCVCSTDGDCVGFDDDQQCNGRLICDGCACAPIETPVGTVCDDGNPATVDDQCLSDSECAGTVPCQCETSADCGVQACVESVCADCQCLKFPAVAGLLYGEETFTGGLPPTWVVTTQNAQVSWGANGMGALKATGLDGTYDYGATDCELVGPQIVLPPGAAILRLEVGLFSAEDTCDDRLEIRVADTLLDTICGPTAIETRSYALPSVSQAAVSLRFVSDADDNAAAGAYVDHVRWIRIAPDACAPPSEVALSAPDAGLEHSPEITALVDGSGWRAVWSRDGLWERLVDSTGAPVGEALPLDPEGDHVSLAGAWSAWERPTVGQILVSGPELAEPVVLPGPEPLRLPAVAEGPFVAYLADTEAGSVLRLWSLATELPQDISGPTPGLSGPRIVATTDGPWLAWSQPDGVFRRSPAGSVGQLSVEAAKGRPDIAHGHGAIAVVWAETERIYVIGGDQPLELLTNAPSAPAIAAFGGGWLVAWTVQGDQDSGVAAAVLTADLSLATPLKQVAQYVFDDQESIRLASINASGDGVAAVWRTSWFDGDPSGVVVRWLTFGADE